MTEKEILNELIKQKIIFKVKGDYFLSKPTTYKQYCKNFPENLKELDIAIVYKSVMNVMPIMRTVEGKFQYLIRTISKPAQKVLHSIITNPKIDYNKFLQSLRDYYNSDIAQKSFSKLLETGEWEVIYENPFKIMEKPDNTTWG